ERRMRTCCSTNLGLTRLGMLVSKSPDEDIQPSLDAGGGAGHLPDAREARDGAEQARDLHRGVLERPHERAAPLHLLVRVTREDAELAREGLEPRGQRPDLLLHQME